MPVYNNPAFGVAAENIAKMFAPPSPGDLANVALAAERNQRTSQLARLFEMAGNNPDELGIALDLFDPTNSRAAQNQNTDTTIRGQDVAARTATTNNAADNARALAERQMQEQGSLARLYAQPVLVNRDQTAFLPAQTAAATSLPQMFTGAISASPGEQVTLPSGKVISGAPKPLSESEVIGAILGRQPEAVQAAVATKGAEPETFMARLPDGTSVVAAQNPNGSLRHAQTGAPLPANIGLTKVPTPQGSNEDLGLGKPARSEIEKRLIDITIVKDTALKLRDMIAQAPASQGAVGWIRGTAQNAIQVGGELGSYFGGGIAEVNDLMAKGLADQDLAGAFDPNIPAIDMLSNLLAFQYAKTSTGERLSNEMLNNTKASLGLDKLSANQADSVARLNMAINRIEAQEEILRSFHQDGMAAGSAPAAAPPTNAAPGEPPRIATPDEYNALPPGAEFIAPDGSRRRKP